MHELGPCSIYGCQNGLTLCNVAEKGTNTLYIIAPFLKICSMQNRLALATWDITPKKTVHEHCPHECFPALLDSRSCWWINNWHSVDMQPGTRCWLRPGSKFRLFFYWVLFFRRGVSHLQPLLWDSCCTVLRGDFLMGHVTAQSNTEEVLLEWTRPRTPC